MSDDVAKVRPPQVQDIEVKSVATSLSGMRKEAMAALIKPAGTSFTIICDEGPDLGGDDSAPPPLSYLASAMAFCLLTQVSRCAKAMKLRVDEARVTVTGHFQREGSLLQGTLQGKCTGFQVELQIDSSDDEEKIAQLIRVAHRSCFVEDAMEHPVPVSRTHLVNGRTLDVTL